MKKKLRIASLIMLIVAIIFIIFAFLTMGVPIDYPNGFIDIMQKVYCIYPVVMAMLFAMSFFCK